MMKTLLMIVAFTLRLLPSAAAFITANLDGVPRR